MVPCRALSQKYARNSNNISQLILFVSLELVSVRGKKLLAPTNSIWYLLGVLFKISDDHSSHFYMGVPQGVIVFDIFIDYCCHYHQICSGGWGRGDKGKGKS